MYQYQLVPTNTNVEMNCATGVHVTKNGRYINGSDGGLMTKRRETRVYAQSLSITGGVRGVMVIVAGYGQGDTSSIPGRDWLHFT